MTHFILARNNWSNFSKKTNGNDLIYVDVEIWLSDVSDMGGRHPDKYMFWNGGMNESKTGGKRKKKGVE